MQTWQGTRFGMGSSRLITEVVVVDSIFENFGFSFFCLIAEPACACYYCYYQYVYLFLTSFPPPPESFFFF
jgi:hypothetical protein